MSTDANSELFQFHQFVGEQLVTGPPWLSPEEALEAWRLQNRTSEEFEEDAQAIREALADMDAGDTGRPWKEFDCEFRKRHKLD